MEDKSNPNVRRYNNHEITLHEADWEFTVTGPEFDNKEHRIAFASYRAARDEIDKRANDTSRVNAQNIKLDLILLDGEGRRVNITRINRSTGGIDCDTRYLYPNVGWVREALLRQKKLLDGVKKIENSISQLRIDPARTYGRIDAEHYGAVVGKLLNTVAEMTKLATEMGTPKEEQELETKIA